MSGIDLIQPSWRLPFLCAALVSALGSSAGAQTIWYVDSRATAPGAGTSWATAFPALDSALPLAQAGDQVWVAEGVYRPQNLLNPPDPRSATFSLPAGIKLYGGFAGNETTLAQRTGLFESTVLSGDIGVPNDSSDNAYHVVHLYAPSPIGTPPTFIDGFLIAHGNADGPPGLDAYGAGIWTFGNKIRLANCTLRFNSAGTAAAVCITNGTLSIVKCTFEWNTATGSGGAMLVQTAFGIVFNSTFRNNTAAIHGGAVHLARQLGSTRVQFIDCLFHDNHSIDGGAAFLEGQGGGGQVGKGQGLWTNCTFAYNFATGSGGALHAHTGAGGPSVSTVHNSIAWNNRASSDPQLFGPHSVSFSDIQGSGGGGTGNIDADPRFINRLGSPRNLRLDTGSPAIDAGAEDLLWVDAYDFDGDGDTAEPISLDLDFRVRIAGAALDMGAYEY